jgi:hypothetical protein
VQVARLPKDALVEIEVIAGTVGESEEIWIGAS